MIVHKIEECLHTNNLVYQIEYNTGMDAEPVSTFRVCEKCSKLQCFSKYVISKKRIGQVIARQSNSLILTNLHQLEEIIH
jgi:hypothetical protein